VAAGNPNRHGYIETRSNKVDLFVDPTNSNCVLLYRNSDDMYLQAIGSLADARTRADAMISASEV